MKKQLLLFVAMLWLAVTGMNAQMFTTSPTPLQQSSQDVKIYFDPSQCDVTALKTATEIYAHIGVTLPSTPNSWSHVVGTWADKMAKKKFTKLSNGLWELNIGDINTYFNLPSGTTISKIAIIALNAAGTAQTKDCFLDVVPAGFYISFTHTPENLVINKATTFTFTVSATENASLSIKVDGKEIGSASNARTLTKTYSFSTQGTFSTVTATGTNGKETRTETVTVAYPTASKQENYPGGKPVMGAVKQSDGSVIFCLAAPQKQSVILVGSWDNYQTLDKNVMKYQDYNGYRYFWTKVSGLKNNEYYPYYYLVDGTIKVSDPCAKLVLDCYSDKWIPAGVWTTTMPQYPYDKFDDTMLAVYRGDIDDYNWDSATKNFKVPDTKSMVVYELLLRDFTGDGSDQDGKRYGTFSSALPKIAYLKNLGVNAVEILPVMEFNGNSSWGYNTNNYMALDKVYGSPKDMRDFVAECHRNGIAVILDIVFNQSDGLMPWYQMYPAGSNPFFNQEAPHAYSVLNDFNQGYQLVQDYWHQVLRYWMEAYKVDGFRFDLVKGLGDNSSYANSSDAVTNAYNANRVARMKALHDVIISVKADGIHINELLGTNQEENANAANGEIGWNKVNDGACQYAMGFADKNGDTKGFYSPNWGKNFGGALSYAESHDEPRVAWKMKEYGASAVKYSSANPKTASVRRLGAVAAQMLLSPGAQMIWEFEEVGADYKMGTDLEKLRAIAPMWNYLDVPVRAGLHENYRQLCNLRLKNPEMFNGTATYTNNGFTNTISSPRWIRLNNGSKEIVGVFNPAVSGQKVNVTVPVQQLNESNYQLITAGYSTTPTLTSAGGNITVSLDANSFAVFATKNISGVEEIMTDFTEPVVFVTGGEGEIIIDGDYNVAEVYNIQGQRMASLEVPAGVYVVRVDGETFKVAVK